MKFIWDQFKNKFLKSERNISFELIAEHIEHTFSIDVLVHHNQDKYPGQKLIVVNIDGRAFAEPFVKEDDNLRLITAFYRKDLTKIYL